MSTRSSAVNLRKSARSHLPAFYLQLVSIFCSLALAYLLEGAAKRLPTSNWVATDWLLQFASLHIIVLAWHEYAIGSAYFRWVLTFADSVIPFLLGICLYWIVHFGRGGESTLAQWYFWVAGYCLVGSAAYLNQWWKAIEDRANIGVMKRLKRYHKTTIPFSLASGGLFGLIGVLYERGVISARYNGFLAATANVMLLLFTLTVVHFEHGAVVVSSERRGFASVVARVRSSLKRNTD